MSERSIEERMAVAETQLLGGAKTFEEIRAAIGDLRVAVAPKPLSRFQLLGFILGPVIGTLVFVGTVVWQAARYPDRQEVDALREGLYSRQEGVEKQLEQLRIERVQMQGEFALMRATLQRIELAIDRSPTARRGPR